MLILFKEEDSDNTKSLENRDMNNLIYTTLRCLKFKRSLTLLITILCSLESNSQLLCSFLDRNKIHRMNISQSRSKSLTSQSNQFLAKGGDPIG